MTELQRIAITVQRRKRTEHFELCAGALRIGSAAYCDIRLAPDEAAPEHIAIEGDERGIVVRNLCPDFPVQLDGMTLTALVLTGTGSLQVGQAQLTLRLLPAAAKVDQRASMLKKVRQIAQLIAVAIGYYVVLHEEPRLSAFNQTVSPPALFEALETRTCRQQTRTSAEAYAVQQLAAADAKRERSPYSERDGVQSVQLFAEAAACFRAAGAMQDADTSLAHARKLAREIQDSLHGHQVRLEWALEQRRFPQAVQELQVLRNLVADRNDTHAVWLAAVARELRALN